MGGWLRVWLLVVLCCEPAVANPTTSLPDHFAMDRYMSSGVSGSAQTDEAITTEMMQNVAVMLLADLGARVCKLTKQHPTQCAILSAPWFKMGMPNLVRVMGFSSLSRVGVMGFLAGVLKVWRATASLSVSQAECIGEAVVQMVDQIKRDCNTTSSFSNIGNRVLQAQLQRMGHACLTQQEQRSPSPSSENPSLENEGEGVAFLEVGSEYAVDGKDSRMEMLGVGQTTGKVAKIIFCVVLIAILLSVVLSHKYWGVAAVGWGNSFQTKVNIVSEWIEFISVVATIFLFSATHGMSIYYRRQQATQFHSAVDSELHLNDAYGVLEPYILAHSVSSFVSSMRSETEMLLSPGSVGYHEMTFEEWNDPHRDHDRPDPLRVLIKFFFVTAKDKAMLDHTDPLIIENDKTTLLRLAYRFRRGVNYEAQLLDNWVDGRDKSRDKLDEVKEQIDEMSNELTSRLHSTWRNLYRLWEHKSKEKQVVSLFETADGWGAMVLALGLLGGATYQFLDLSPECPSLMTSANAVAQKMPRLSSKAEAEMPNLFYAMSWQCTHDPLSSIEEGGVCIMQCDMGYDAVKYLSVCDSLGGGGISWTHLNAGVSAGGKGDRSLDLPSCCPTGSMATILNDISLDVSGGVGTVSWTTNNTLQHACGISQSVAIQLCSYDSSTVTNSVSAKGYCSMICEPDEGTDLGCLTQTIDDLVPTAEWDAIDQDRTEINDYTSQVLNRAQMEFPAGFVLGSVQGVPQTSNSVSLLYRVGVTNKFGQVFGKWVVYGS